MIFKYNFFLLLFLFCCTSIFSQKKKNSFEKELDKLNCKKINHVNMGDLAKIYPFNYSSKIILTSYQNRKPGPLGEELMDYLDTLPNQKIDSTVLSKFKEFKVLDKNQKFNLLDIINNYGYRDKPTVQESTKCYFPQNAILFVGPDEILIDFVELCFGCSKFRTNNDKITLGEECSQKYDLIKQLFTKTGVLYGTLENEL